MPAQLRRLLLACLPGFGVLVACGPDAPKEGAPAALVADAELCAPHGVLQSVCTQCNPSLAPVFQAKGDWCPEHGFPESFCPTCSPEAEGRPSLQPTATDGAPADGTKVRFKTRATAEQAGIEVVEAEAVAWVDGTDAVVRIVWDATRTAAVSAATSGVVTGIEAEVGDWVVRGDALARLQSPEAGGDRARLRAAQRALTFQEELLERQRALLDQGAVSERSVQEAETAVAAARAERDAVEAELRVVRGGARDRAVLRAPMDGVVIARNARVGQVVDDPHVVFELVDPSRMWAAVDVAERDLAHVAAGQAVQVRLDALPDDIFEGTIATLSPAVDPNTRTANARVVLDNPDGRLRAQLTGTATIRGTTATEALVVPEAAVQRAGDVHLVFVRETIDTYVARRVRVLARQGDRVRIAGAVKSGAAVVTTGSFLLKTETLKDSIGAGCCDVE